MYARVASLGIYGLDGYGVTVEADTSNGLPSFEIVGLPDVSVSESRNRVRAAVKNSGYDFPVSRITVNLAPADKRKFGPLYDLPILLSVLVASNQLRCKLEGSAFVGELALDGVLRPVNGVLPMVLAARRDGIRRVFVPAENAREAALVEGLDIFGVKNIKQLMRLLCGELDIAATKPLPFSPGNCANTPDMSDVKGQYLARRAMEIAAAGGHNLLMIGPPGAGKSMLAKRLPSILPPMSYEEAIETTKLYSIAAALSAERALIDVRPFRSPHHTVSPAGLSGGGTIPRPGEISLAHNGVLFLDELPEFSQKAMEVLRQPIEDDVVTVSRVSGSVTFPCSAMIVAAMNPCPCGNFGSALKKCTCAPFAVERYLSRISGPLLDRLDLHVEVSAVDYGSLSGKTPGECSATIRERVVAAREIQVHRFSDTLMPCNAKLSSRQLAKAAVLTCGAQATMKRAFESLGFSARAYDKVLKVARTIADLAKSELVDSEHIAEAVQYRMLDKKYWER